MAKSPRKPAGKKPANSRSRKKQDAAPAPQTTLLLPPATVITSLAKAKENAKKQMTGISGDLGTKIAKAIEEKHVDRKALAIACQLDRLDDERLHITYIHLLKYFEYLGIAKRALAQAELFEERIADVDAETDTGNVTSIGAAARRVAEEAGQAQSA